MKSTKPKLPVPLLNGALITRREITLGLGHTATIEIRYDGPNQSAPDIGTNWPPETDWPAAKITLHLPNRWNGSNQPHYDLHANISVLGNRLDTNAIVGSGTGWGDSGDHKGAYRTRRRAGTSLRQLAAELLREVLTELRPVQAHLKARAVRLAQRDATLQAGLDARPLPEPAKTN